RAFDRRHERHAASEWSSFVGEHSRHALVTTLSGVRVNCLAHLRLLRILKLPALRKRQKIKTHARKLDRVIRRILNSTATGDHFIRQKPHSDDVIVSDTLTNRAINFERQPNAILPRSAVTV